VHFTLADLIADITQNACESGADLVELEVKEGSPSDEGGNGLRFEVKDNGKGMTKEELQRAVDPFVTDGVKHPHRKIGLGLPFLIQTAEQSGGG
jgi:nitrogen fixation/metabolism regulation signal transduction histidine kinase